MTKLYDAGHYEIYVRGKNYDDIRAYPVTKEVYERLKVGDYYEDN